MAEKRRVKSGVAGGELIAGPGRCDWLTARAFRDRLTVAGGKLVLTNGCFDLLHVGHVRYLAQARALGDALVVAVNGDASVRALKGPERPAQTAEDRAEILASLRAVDAVVIFEELRAEKVIEALAPQLYVKGGDYTRESLDAGERALLERLGVEIHVVDLTAGRSTSATLARLRRGGAGQDGPVLRLGVLGSGRGSTLEGLLAGIEDGRLPAEIVLVASDVAGARILQVASGRGIPAVHVDPGPARNRLGEGAQKEICDRMRAAGVELVVLAGFMRRVKAPLLAFYAGRILNVHPSLLPKYPGREAWRQALEAGEPVTGCTVHVVDTGIDTGPAVAQRETPVLPGDTPESLHARIQEAERALLIEVIARYAVTGRFG